jgi:signal transduction histidine kinase
MTRQPGLRLWQKFSLLLAVSILILAGGISIVTWYSLNAVTESISIEGKTILANQAEAFLRQRARISAELLDAELDRASGTASYGAAAWSRLLTRPKPDAQRLDALLKDLIHRSDTAIGAYAIAPTGDRWSYGDGREDTIAAPASAPSPALGSDAGQGQGDVFWSVVQSRGGSLGPGPSIDAVARTSADLAGTGYVGLEISLARLTTKLSTDAPVGSGYTFLIDQDRRLLAAPPQGRTELARPDQLADSTPITLADTGNPALDYVLHNMALGGAGLAKITIKGESKYVAYHPVARLGWSVGIVISVPLAVSASQQLVDRMTDSRLRALTEMLFWGFGLLLLSMTIGILMNRRLAAPIAALTEATRHIAAGNFARRIEVASHDEIGDLAHDFNAMTARLQILVSSLEQRVQERLEAEQKLQQLNSQLESRVAGRTHELEVANRALLQANIEAERASRAKSDFLANMSHELRTPLNAVIGYSEALLLGHFGTLSPQHHEYLAIIKDSGALLLSLINDILDLAKVEAGKFDLRPDLVDLRSVIDATLRLVAERAGRRGLLLQCSIADDLPAIKADPRAIQQVLLNVVTNAIKFTAHGGSVSLTAASQGDDWISLRVTDTGIGMRAADLARVFEPFVQAENIYGRSHEGSGLGLPLSKSLVELHGGRLTVESELHKGTTVTILLPRDLDQFNGRQADGNQVGRVTSDQPQGAER